MTTSSHAAPIHKLAMRVHEAGQLFNSMDPTPFLNKDLDLNAETFIENWAFGYSPKSRFQITIHIEKWPEQDDLNEMLASAIHNHFAYKAERTRGRLKYMLRQGRTSMAVGIVFVSACLIAADAVGKMGANPGFNIARESLTIVGWVAMWRPLQMFLYDWWPVLHKIRLYQRLSTAHITAIQGK